MKRRRALAQAAICLFSFVFCIGVKPAWSEDGAAGWLRYSRLTGSTNAHTCAALPEQVLVLASASDSITHSAGNEILRGIRSMCDHPLHAVEDIPAGNAIVIGTVPAISANFSQWRPAQTPGPEGYTLTRIVDNRRTYLIIAGADPRGTLYGSFAFLSQLAQARNPSLTVPELQSPANRIRWVNQWDNLDGSIERGYAGRSIFFDAGHVRADLHRASEYARLLASVGINGCTINNVNADTRMLTPDMLDEVARIADAFRPWGVRLSMSIDFSSPQAVGGLKTFDPLDPQVAAWWAKSVDAIYTKIPDFAGFVVKADSEGKPGPSQYGRSPAQAANVLAHALAPHGGLVLYRGFVYNHHLDWHDMKADRARAGYDNFHTLDGTFADNVVIQIKNGPIDFQVREPASPLFAALRKTNQAFEAQITQEYLGQQRHLVYLVPMWKATLDTDMRADNRPSPVKEIVEGKSFHRPLGGFVGVANVGLDTNWLAHPLAMANLYGFARLAWNPSLSSKTIIDEWTRLTFGNDPLVDRTIDSMQLKSWHLYEDYTGPLGLGTLTDIIGTHYGPGIASAENNGWGQWLRADHQGIGMDRTVATGTGYIGQYPPQLTSTYESLKTCPDDLLLFMHHVPYNYTLHSGKTLIQHVYDSHYDGAIGAAQLATQWQQLQGHIDDQRYQQVLALQQYQADHAIVWRDAVSNWFLRMSGIPDSKGRVGHYPQRIEAESMSLDNYTPTEVDPWETASGGKAVVCHVSECAATTTFAGTTGTYRISVEYFDFHDGASAYSLRLNGKEVGHWLADNTLPTNKMNGSTSTRYRLPGAIDLKRGDRVTITGHPDGGEPAPLDYLSLEPLLSAHAPSSKATLQ